MVDKQVQGRCGAKCADGSYCMRYPKKGADFCYHHSDDESEGPGVSPIHAIDSNRSKYYQNLEGEEQAWIDALIESFLVDAPFDEENTGKLEILRQAVIDMHKNRNANTYIQEEELAQTREVEVDGEMKEVVDENVLNLSASRLSRDSLKRLREIGVLDDPDSQQAEATQSLAKVLSGGKDE